MSAACGSTRAAVLIGQLPGIVEAAGLIKADTIMIDVELTGASADDKFYAMATAIKRRQVCVVAFDLMHHDGEDMRLTGFLTARRYCEKSRVAA